MHIFFAEMGRATGAVGGNAQGLAVLHSPTGSGTPQP